MHWVRQEAEEGNGLTDQIIVLLRLSQNTKLPSSVALKLHCFEERFTLSQATVYWKTLWSSSPLLEFVLPSCQILQS